jgi:hypothetical protein
MLAPGRPRTEDTRSVTVIADSATRDVTKRIERSHGAHGQFGPPVRAYPRGWRSSAAAGASATAAPGPLSGVLSAASHADGGQELHGVGVALRAGGGVGGAAHRTGHLEGVAAGAAPELVTRHAHRVGRGYDGPGPGRGVVHRHPRGSLGAGAGRVMSSAWRRGRRQRLGGPGRCRRTSHRTWAGRSGVPAPLRSGIRCLGSVSGARVPTGRRLRSGLLMPRIADLLFLRRLQGRRLLLLQPSGPRLPRLRPWGPLLSLRRLSGPRLPLRLLSLRRLRFSRPRFGRPRFSRPRFSRPRFSRPRVGLPSRRHLPLIRSPRELTAGAARPGS